MTFRCDIIYIRDDFFQLFNIFRILFCGKKNPKITGHSQNRSIMTFLKGGVNGFCYFHLIISYSVFYCLSRIIPDTCMFFSVYLLMCILLLLYVFFVVQLLLVFFFCRNFYFFILAHFSIYVVDTVYRPCFFHSIWD